MTGKELINLIVENGLEDNEITNGHLELSDDDADETIIVYPVKYSTQSNWPTFPTGFNDWIFARKCDWYVEFLHHGPYKPFSHIERVPNVCFVIIDSIFDGIYRNVI